MSLGLFKNFGSVNESRSQIKRKYGEYSSIKVNEKAPVRNEILRFVGKRFVTNEEMTNFLTKISEDRGKEINSTQWFNRNQRYFEKFENRGQSVWTLSKYGKRVLEFIIKGDSKQKLNESEMAELVNALNEGTLAKKGAKDLSDMNLDVQVEYGDDMKPFYLNVAKKLGEKPKDVFQVDSETNDEDPLMSKIYNYLQLHFNGDNFDAGDFNNSMGQACLYDPKLNVVRIDDYGFVAFYFTAKSNF